MMRILIKLISAAMRIGERITKLPVNLSLAAYYNVVRPDFGANWQLQAQAKFMFSK